MSVDLTSIVECRNLYIDYYYKGNKADTSRTDIKLIEKEYTSYLAEWRRIGQGVENDTNDYVFDESDWEICYEDGEKDAKNTTGYTKGSSGNGWKIAGNATATTLGVGFAIFGGGLVEGVGEKAAEKAAAKATAKAVSKGVEKGSEKAAEAGAKAGAEAGAKVTDKAKNASWVFAIPIALLSAGLALGTDQNSEEAGALAELTDLLGDAQDNIYDAQLEMEDAATTVAKKEQELIDYNDTSNKQMVNLQTKSNSYFNTYNYLMQKQTSGGILTAGELSLMTTMQTKVNQNNETQTNLKAKTEEDRTSAVDELGTYTTVFDSAAESMANTQGMTDYGASFDKCTKVLCFVAIASDLLNAGNAVLNGYRAGVFAVSGAWFTAWAWAFVAMAAGAVYMSGKDAINQYNYLKTVNTEIDTRETTEELNVNVAGTYDNDITEYDASIQSLSGLETLELEQKSITYIPSATTIQYRKKDDNK